MAGERDVREAGPVTHPPSGFHHEAFFYDGVDEYVEHLVAFIRTGLDAGEPVFVAVPAAKVALLEPHFPDVAPEWLRFASMEELGRNPAWIIPAWADFAGPQVAAGRPARGIGEPIWADRSADELVECTHHEALINLAFADAVGFTLLCPYDLATLAAGVVDEAHRTHPHVCRSGVTAPSDAYRPDVPTLLEEPLAPRPAGADEAAFDAGSLGAVRSRVRAAATAAGLDDLRVADLLVAVSEAMTNAVLHGGGGGTLAWWHDGDRFVCQVSDAGRLADPLAGRRRPSATQVDGRGLWLIHQLCDLVQLRGHEGGQTARLHVAI